MIPERYKNMGFTRVGQKKKSTRAGKKWMVLAKKGDQYKVVHGGAKGMSDYTKHKDEDRRDRFWKRHNAGAPGKSKDPFSPLYWHKKFGTWQEGGEYEYDDEDLIYGYEDDYYDYEDEDEYYDEEEYEEEEPVKTTQPQVVNQQSSNPYTLEQDAMMKYMGKKIVGQNIGFDKMEYLKDVERLTGTPAELLYGVYGTESSFGKRLISEAGAKGPFQFMPKTAEGMGLKDPFDFKSSALAAGRYLADLKSQFKDWNLALTAYNAGPGRLREVLRGTAKTPLTKESIEYAPKVLNYASQFVK